MPYVIMLLFLSISPLLFRYPHHAFLALLILRNIADVMSDVPLISLGGMTINLAGLIGLFFIGWSMWYFFQFRPILLTRDLAFPAIFILICTASVFTSLDPVKSAQDLIKFVNLVCIFIIAYDFCKTMPRYTALISVLASAIIIPATAGLVQLARGTGLSVDIQNRLMGTYVHPNSFAFALVIAISSWVILSFLASRQNPLISPSDKKLMSRLSCLPYPLILATLGILLLLTYTRGAWIGIAIILLAYFLCFHVKKTIIIIALIAFTVFAFPHISDMIFAATGYDMTRSQVIQRLHPPSDETDSFMWRLRSWKEVSVKLHGMPIFGYGPAMYAQVRESTVSYLTDIGTEAHNDYLRLALETGYLGAASYFLFFIANLIQCIQGVRTARFLLDKKIYIVVAATITAFLIMSISDNILRSTPVNWLLWALMGGTTGMIHAKKHEAQRLLNQLSISA
ncbi:MAG: O-antigen ligase family protein [Patescibacteria group bacterium]